MNKEELLMFKKANRTIVIFTLLMLAAMVIPMIISPDATAQLIGKVFTIMTLDFAWLFMLLGLFCAAVAVFVGFSKYGDIRLGGANAKPHYSRFSWISMNLCSALAAGILIFGMCEWMYYVQGPPFGLEPKSIAAYEYASAYGMFHWGFSAWSFYLIPSLAIGYMYWNKNIGSLRISDSCSGLLGDDPSKYKFIRNVIDVFVTFCYVAGLMCTVGLGTPVMAELVSSLTGIPTSFALKIAVIIVFCLFFMLSTSKTIAKGMAVISNFNVKLALAFFAFVFITGPKSFILNNFTMAIGKNFQEFFKMSLYTDSVAKTGFIQGWTIFYWAWYVALAVATGLWVARVSYGRTFREIVFANCVVSPLACWVTFGLLGNYGMNLELTGKLDLSTMVIEQGTSPAVLAVLKTMPLSVIAVIVFLILIFFNLATSATATSTVISMITSDGLKKDEEPNKWYKVFWSLSFLVLPIGILFLEKTVQGLSVLKTLQSVTTVIAIPMLFVLTILIWSFVKVLKNDIKLGNIYVDPDKRHKWDEAIKKANSEV